MTKKYVDTPSMSKAFYGVPTIKEIEDSAILVKGSEEISANEAFSVERPSTPSSIEDIHYTVMDRVMVDEDPVVPTKVSIQESLQGRSTTTQGDTELFKAVPKDGYSAVDVISRATHERVGIVQIGKNINVSPEGVIDINLTSGDGFGLVKVGDNIKFNDGVISLDKTGKDTYGLVKVGDNIDVENGIISVKPHPQTHPASMIETSKDRNFVTSDQIAGWNKAMAFQDGVASKSLTVDLATGNSDHVVLKNSGTTIGSFGASPTGDIVIRNSASKKSLVLKANGDSEYPAQNLITPEKELVAAVNNMYSNRINHTIIKKALSSSWKKSVIAFCRVLDKSQDKADFINSYACGRLFVKCYSGLHQSTYIDFAMNSVHNKEHSMYCNFTVNGWDKNAITQIRPCVFKYNGVWYGGLDIWTTAESNYAEFIGISTLDPLFGLDYDNNFSSSVTTEDKQKYNISPVKEVVDSINYDNVTYNNDVFYRHDSTLITDNKDIVGAINELKKVIDAVKVDARSGKFVASPEKWLIGNDSGEFGIDLSNSDIVGVNSVIFNDVSETADEGILFPKTGTKRNSNKLDDYDSLWIRDGVVKLNKDRTLLDLAPSRKNTNLMHSWQFEVGGDHDKYYPFVITFRRKEAILTRVCVWRFYGAKAPNEWTEDNSPTHHGGLTVDLNVFVDGWGGMNYLVDGYVGQRYATIVGGIQMLGPATNLLCIWLRGGGAQYTFESEMEPESFTVYLEKHEFDYGDGHTSTVEPKAKPAKLFDFKDGVIKISSAEEYRKDVSDRGESTSQRSVFTDDYTLKGILRLDGDMHIRGESFGKEAAYVFDVRNPDSTLSATAGMYFNETSGSLDFRNYKADIRDGWGMISIHSNGTVRIPSKDLNTGSKNVVGAINELSSKLRGNTTIDKMTVKELHGVELIKLASQSTDTAYISTTVDQEVGYTYVDFNLSDDCNQDKFRWLFRSCENEGKVVELMTLTQSAAGEHTALLTVDGDIVLRGKSLYKAITSAPDTSNLWSKVNRLDGCGIEHGGTGLFIGYTDEINMVSQSGELFLNYRFLNAGKRITSITLGSGAGTKKELATLNTGKIVSTGEIFANTQSKVWHSGNFNPDSKYNRTGGTISGIVIIDAGDVNDAIKILRKGTNKGEMFPHTDGINIWNSASKKRIKLFDNGSAMFEATNLKTANKEVVAAINELCGGVTAQQIGGTYTGSGGKQGPKFVGNGKVRFLMSNEIINGDGSYKDWLFMDTYSGSDVPISTAFGVNKDGSSLRAFIMNGPKGGENWNRKAELWTTANFNPATKLNTSGGTISGSLTVTGRVVSNDDVVAFSDKRLKENILPITDALDKIDKLEGVTFNWKKNGEKSIGLIAQNVQDVIPEAVVTIGNKKTEGEDTLAVKYANLVGVLINGIKELRAEVKELKATVHDLKKSR